MTIFSLKFIAICGDVGKSGGDVRVHAMTVEKLREWHSGNPDFVRSILTAVTRGFVYNDGDPSSGTVALYLPATEAQVIATDYTSVMFSGEDIYK